MSRRKQEKPQPRKNLIKGEVPDLISVPDILTCGACQKHFPLGEIVRFIQHKVQLCNKENHSLLSYDDDFDEEGNGEDDASLLRTTLKKEPGLLEDECPPPLPPQRVIVKEEHQVVSSSSIIKRALSAKDAASSVTPNHLSTTHEPRHYVCSTCKQSLSTAWALIQHVQNAHGLSICMDSSSTSDDKSENSSPMVVEPSAVALSGAPYALRAPLLERQMEPLPLFAPRSSPSSQDLRLDLIGKSSNGPIVPCVTPPPLLLEPPKISNLQDSSYSQRLRVLAGATSPSSTTHSAATTPRKLLQPNFKAMLNNNHKTSPTRSSTPPELSSSLSGGSPPEQRVQSSTAANNTSPSADPPAPPTSSPSSSAKGGSTTTTNNNRLCEYCGKSFQFKSNLIVHRRSHTGEKPFKCHICNHACTQASKLKRHMKTHRRASLNSSKKQQLRSSSRSTNKSTEDQGNGSTNGDDSKQEEKDSRQQVNGECVSNDEDMIEEEEIDVEDEENEEDENDDEEEVNVDGLEEDEDEDCLRENGNLVIDHPTEEEDNMVAEDLTKKKPLNNGTASATENGKEDSRKSSEDEEDCRRPPTKHHSVISEIMEKIGFGCIPPYNEAYRQALKESSFHRNNSLKDRCSSGTDASNDAGSRHSYDVLSTFQRPPRDGTRSAGQSPLGFGSGLLLDSFDQSVINIQKRIRLDDAAAAKDKDGNLLYAGVWFPRVEPPPPAQSHYRDLYGLDGNTSSTTHHHHKSESASSGGGRPGPSSLAAAAKPKDSSGPRRNDTCEFCGKVFKNCSNLTVHRRSHTGEKPYKCELCSYACAQSSKLTRHMKTHGRLGKDVYRCRFCDMPFSVASTLEKHMRKCVVSQSGGSPYLVSEDSKEMTA